MGATDYCSLHGHFNAKECPRCKADRWLRVDYEKLQADLAAERQKVTELEAENKRLNQFVKSSGTTCFPCPECGRGMTSRDGCLWCKVQKAEAELAALKLDYEAAKEEIKLREEWHQKASKDLADHLSSHICLRRHTAEVLQKRNASLEAELRALKEKIEYMEMIIERENIRSYFD